MTLTESIILYITAAVSLAGVLIGILAYRLELNNRRNAMRELVYAKQFEFYLYFNGLVALIDDSFCKCRDSIKSNENLDEILEEIENRIDELDSHFSKNEILITDSLYLNMSKYISLSYKAWSDILKEKSSLDEGKLDRILERSTVLCTEIMACLGIEELSKENTNLTIRSNSKIAMLKKIN